MEKNKKGNELPAQVVTTATGRLSLKSDCKFIDGKYYLIGDPSIENSGDCYLMDSSGKYVRITSDLIIYDHAVKQYVYKNTKSFHKGVVEITDTGELNFGYFTYKRLYLLPQIVDREGSKHYCVNEQIIENQKLYKESLKDGLFYLKSSKRAVEFTKIPDCSQEEKRRLSYSVDADLIKSNKISHKEGFDYPYNDFVKDLGHFTNDFTFGLEFETTKGLIPQRICRKLGLIPLRDGSVDGLEYVTIPLKGRNGLQTVIESAKQLKRRTEIDSNCSLHLHIGGVPRTEKFFLALYKVLFLLQDEIFEMFPIYKKEHRGLKKKHFTKPLYYKDVMLHLDKSITDDNLTENFAELFRYLSMGRDYSEYQNSLDNVISHPSDPNGTSKWNIKSRYNWVNLIPLLFGNKQTIEFRVHTATHHYGKIMLYMVICMGLVQYAIEYQNEILKNPRSIRNINIRSMLRAVNTSDYLVSLVMDYFSDRKYFINSELKRGNVMTNEEEFYSSSANAVLNYGGVYHKNTKLRYGINDITRPFNGIRPEELRQALDDIPINNNTITFNGG